MTQLIRRLRRRVDAETGSALIVALVVVVAVGIMLSAVLDFAGTGITTGARLRDLRNVNYYAEGAVDGAINQIRGSSTSGTASSCPEYDPPAPASTVLGAAN